MHLTLDSIIRRVLVYRLMRYRFAWLAFRLVGLYLAAALALAPASVDARLTRIHALAAFGSMGDNERLA